MSWIEHVRSANWHQGSFIFACAYLLGCFTSGYYLVRWLAGQDLRELGSGSVGARNVGRILGKTGFALTVLADVTKGMIAVWAVRHYTTDPQLILLGMVAVVAGHIWPVQLRFRGGKGMATALGSLLMYDAPFLIVFMILFLVLAAFVRRTTLPALVALACVPLTALWFDRPPADVTLLCTWAGLVVVAHRKNIMVELAQLSAVRREPATESDPPSV